MLARFFIYLLITQMGLLFCSTAQECLSPPSGLVAWWTGDANASDLTAFENHGTPYEINHTPGKVEPAFQFNGTTSGITVPASQSLAVESLTFDAWIFPTAIDQRPIIEYSNPGELAGAHFWIGTHAEGDVGSTDPGALYANLRASASVNHVIQVSNVIPANEWSFVALTYDQSSGIARLYVNGEVVQEQNLGSFTPDTSAPVHLGSRPGPGGISFAGNLDEVEIFNRALAPEEIQAIFAAGSAGKCKPMEGPCLNVPAGLVGWWDGDGTAQDLSHHENHGTPDSINYTQAIVGTGFEFDGSTASVTIPPSPSLAVTSLTWDAWIFPTDDHARPILEYGNENDWAGAHLWIGARSLGESAGAIYANLRTGPFDNRIIEAQNAIQPGEWHFIAVTYDQPTGVAKIFVNGEKVQETILGTFQPRTEGRLNIGQRPATSSDGSAGTYFSGIIDEVEIYDRALSETEIAAIFKVGSAGKCKPRPACIPAGLVGWWTGDHHADDVSENQPESTVQAISYTEGRSGHGFQFDGLNSAITVPPSSSLAVESLTFDAWIYPTDITQRPVIEYTDEQDWAGAHFWIGTHAEGNQGFDSPGALYANLRESAFVNHVIQVPDVIPANEWSFVALTYDKESGIARLYVNEEMVKEQELGSFTPDTTGQLNIGSRPLSSSDGANGRRFAGILDEVEIFNRALSPAELLTIYHDGKCKPELPLVAIRFIPDTSEQPWPDSDFAPGSVEIHRSGPTDEPLAVTYSLSGTATPGVDYEELPQTILIPAGEDSIAFQITALDDELSEGSENVVLTLTRSLPGADYYIDSTFATAQVTILDNEPAPDLRPVLALEVIDPLASEPFSFPPDHAVFRIKRVAGPLDTGVAVRIALAGSAQNGGDYLPIPDTIQLPPGAVATHVTIRAVPDNITEEEESVVLTLLEGPCLLPGNPAPDCYLLADAKSGEIIIRDPLVGNEPPAVAITRPHDGAVFVQGEPIIIRVMASDSDGIARLEVFSDNIPIRISSGGLLEFAWTAPVGEHTLTARAIDTRGAVGVAAPVRILVRTLNTFVTRDLPESYTPGTTFVVTLRTEPPFGTSAYAIEDQPPSGWTVTDISHNGAFDALNGKVKFGPFTDDRSRTFTYSVTPPVGATGDQEFTGFSALSGQGYPIGGDQVIRGVTSHHPADTNNDFQIVLLELASYAAAWKEHQGEPGPGIPLPFLTRAAFLWKSGEAYEFDPSAGHPPFSWVPATQEEFSALSASLASAERALSGELTPGATLTITISAAPPEDASGYAVEENIPAGWSVISVSHQGFFDSATSTIRWGLFMDSDPRNLTYKLTVPAELPSSATLAGKLSFDGSVQDITGQAELGTVPADLDVWFHQIQPIADDGMRLGISGPPGQICVLETSTDLVNWEELATTFLPDGSLDYLDETAESGSNRYYRIRVR